jgi:aldehyde dehydrogenase (NAD+)
MTIDFNISLRKDSWDKIYVGGEWLERGNRSIIKDLNPFDGSVVAEVPSATADDVNRAFEVAVRTQKESTKRTPQEIQRPLLEAISYIEKNREGIRDLLIDEGGSSIYKAGFEIDQVAIPMMQEAASYPFRAFGSQQPSIIPGKENIVRRIPAGVVGIISPWNVPLHLSMRAVAPALALGNAVVLKPSSDTPIAGGLLLAKIFDSTSLPKGLLSVLPGAGGDIGDLIATDPRIRVMAFTGSTDVGRKVASKAALSLARPAMELGGNNPQIVLEDADIERAVDGGVFGSFFHQGQICMRINRHLVHESVYEDYVAKLTERAAKLPFGNPRDQRTKVGPVINETQKDRIMDLIEQSVKQGAKITVGGKAHELVIEPTVLRDMRNDMPAAWNEVFGPVAPVIPFGSDEEAVTLANATRYGLAASVYSKDLGHAHHVAIELEAGMVHINDQTIQDEHHVPFGGVKGSGIGRYNGEAIIQEMTELQWMSVQNTPRDYSF